MSHRLTRFLLRGRNVRQGQCLGCLECLQPRPCAGDGWQMHRGWRYRRIGNSNFPRSR